MLNYLFLFLVAVCRVKPVAFRAIVLFHYLDDFQKLFLSNSAVGKADGLAPSAL